MPAKAMEPEFLSPGLFFTGIENELIVRDGLKVKP